MNIFRNEYTLVFQWCNGWSIQELDREIEPGKVSRVCYITTQKRRVYLVKSSAGFSYVPMQLANCGWTKLFDHEVATTEVKPEHLESESALRSAMEFQITLQFRNVVHGYYEDPPSAKEINASLPNNPTVGDLERRRYTVYETHVQRDTEWDGAVQVHCENGLLLYPFVREEGRSLSEAKLIVKYRTFVPYSAAEEASHWWNKFADAVLGFFDNLHWSNFRNRIERMGGQKG